MIPNLSSTDVLWRVWLVTLALGLFLAGRWFRRLRLDPLNADVDQIALWLTALALSLLWWLAAGQFQPARVVAMANIAIAAFAGGAIVGFIFTSYSEEEASVGKIREWLVAGISGLALAEAVEQFRAVSNILRVFARDEADFGLIAGNAIFYSVLGFFGMFLNRELILNLLLERSRASIRDLRRASAEVDKPLEAVAESRPVGSQPPAAAATAQLEGEAVHRFVRLAESALDQGRRVDFDTLWRLGRTYLYREEVSRAVPLLKRAASLRPQDPEVLVDLAEAVGDSGDRDQAIKLLEKALTFKPPPPRALRLLGYYLLWDSARLDDAIRFNEEYLKIDPSDSGAIFNIAAAHGQLTPLAADKDERERHRQKTLEVLRRAIGLNASWKQRALELINDDFEAFKTDKEFLDLVNS